MTFALGDCPDARQAAPPGTTGAPAAAAVLPADTVWTRDLDAAPSADAAADRSRIYVPLEDQHVISLARDTGALIWTATLGTRWPITATGRSVFVATEHDLHELSAASGDLIRRVPLPAAVTGPITRAGELLLVPVEPDLLIAWHLVESREVWRRPVGSSVAGRGVVSGTRAFFSTSGSRVVAIAIDDGRVVWSKPLAGRLTEPAVSLERIVVGSTADRVYALNVADGRVEWEWPVWADVVGVAADAERVYVVALDNIVRALRRGNGNQRWKEPIVTRAQHRPVVAGTTLLIPGIDPVLTGFDAATGASHGRYAFPTESELPVLGAAPLLLEHASATGVRMVLFTRAQAIGLAPRPPASTTAAEAAGRGLSVP